jgi:hypothetical protein
VCWLTYFPVRRSALPELPEYFSSIEIEGYGTIVITTPERLDPGNLEHIARLEELTKLLSTSGLLQ